MRSTAITDTVATNIFATVVGGLASAHVVVTLVTRLVHA